MTKCPNMARCPLLEALTATAPHLAGEVRRDYCYWQHSICARYMLLRRLGAEHIPTDLMPHEIVRAMEIIKRAPLPNSLA